jgi:hypothetical protein
MRWLLDGRVRGAAAVNHPVDEQREACAGQRNDGSLHRTKRSGGAGLWNYRELHPAFESPTGPLLSLADGDAGTEQREQD